MYLWPRTSVGHLACRSCRRSPYAVSRALYRRHYATEGAVPIQKIRRPDLGASLNPQDRSLQTMLKAMLKAIDSDTQGVQFGNPDAQCYFEHLALRDMCQCSKCVDPSTKQRHFAFADIPSDIQGRYRAREDGQLEVEWINDIPGFEADHKSVFSIRQLFSERDRRARAESHNEQFKIKPWNTRELSSMRPKLEFSFSDFTNPESDHLQARAVGLLLTWGLIFIKDVPPKIDSVVKILNTIGPIRNTFYGETWDVRSVPDAQNVAYTSRDLGFHQDLLYMADPPGLQALHMIKASSTGGESLFTDGAKAAEALIKESPQHLAPLSKFDVTYRYQNAGEWYEYSRPTLEGYFPLQTPNAKLNFRYLNWSPPFQGPFLLNRGFEQRTAHQLAESSHLHQYRDAAEALRKKFEAPEAVYETRMEPGTCVIFNNRRILHARKAFPVGGGGAAEERWLRGAYADLDPLMSRYRMAKLRAAEREQSAASIGASTLVPWTQPSFRKHFSGKVRKISTEKGPSKQARNDVESEQQAPKVSESEITKLEAFG